MLFAFFRLFNWLLNWLFHWLFIFNFQLNKAVQFTSSSTHQLTNWLLFWLFLFQLTTFNGCSLMPFALRLAPSFGYFIHQLTNSPIGCFRLLKPATSNQQLTQTLNPHPAAQLATSNQQPGTSNQNRLSGCSPIAKSKELTAFLSHIPRFYRIYTSGFITLNMNSQFLNRLNKHCSENRPNFAPLLLQTHGIYREIL